MNWCSELQAWSILFVPGALQLALTALWIWRKFTETKNDLPVADLLAFTWVKVLPLVVLKWKLRIVDHRMVLLSSFASKVLLVHAGFLLIRLVFVPFLDLKDMAVELTSPVYIGWNVVAFIAALLGLRLAFKCTLTLENIWEHKDVTVLVAGASAAALVLNYGDPAAFIILTADNYVETLAYLPALWIIRQIDLVFAPMPHQDAWAQAIFFMTFMCCFYVHEDVISPITGGFLSAPLVMATHVFHFAMLLDHLLFFINDAYKPKSADHDICGEALQTKA